MAAKRKGTLFARRGAPPLKSEIVTIRVTPEEKKELRKAAHLQGVTLSDLLVTEALKRARAEA